MGIILIPIRFGYKEDGQFLGWSAIQCRYCKTLQPAACFDVSRSPTIYGVKVLGKHPYSKRLVCSFCTETHDFRPETQVVIAADWKPEQGIADLASKTLPGLRVATHGKGRTEGEVMAVLNRCDEWATHAYHHKGNKGCTFGLIGVVAILVGAYIGYEISPASSPTARGGEHNYAVAFGVPFGLAVTFLAYLVLKQISLKRTLRKQLEEFGQRLSITKGDYQRVLHTMPRAPRRLRDAVSSLIDRTSS